MVRRITREIMGVKSSQNDTAVFFCQNQEGTYQDARRVRTPQCVS